VSTDAVIADLLQRARLLESTGQDEAAKAVYLALLRLDATHFAALIELGNLALATGHRSAARTAYRQAVQYHPDNPIARVNLGNVYYQDEDLAAARRQYEAALAVDDCFAEAHQGLARTLDQLGETAAAAPHWQRGLLGRAVVAPSVNQARQRRDAADPR
jgi:tetratricopeptide (TPR) repeat protein